MLLFLLAAWSWSARAQSIQDLGLGLFDLASDWVENEYVRSRLVFSHEGLSQDGSISHFLGWQVELKKKDWKTYWRTPGDAGKPPVFDWTGSTNLAETQTFFPLPERFEIFGIQTFGYSDGIIIPIRMETMLDGLPVGIRMTADFMACKDICIPFLASYEMNIPVAQDIPRDSQYELAIARQLQRVPSTEGPGAQGPWIRDVGVNGVPGIERLSLIVEGVQLLSGADVIVEADENFRLGAPQRSLQGDGTRLHIVVPVSSRDKGRSLAGEDVRLTVSDGWGRAWEHVIKIPAS